jgi:hypothetical protein
MKKLIRSLAAAACLAIPAAAGDYSGAVQLIYPCNNDWYEVQLEGVTAPWQGTTKAVRFMVKSSNLGVDLHKKHFTMHMTSFATGSMVWFATSEAQNTFSGGSNCGGGNTPGATVIGGSIFR